MRNKVLGFARRTFLRAIAGGTGVSALAAQAPRLLTEQDRIDIGGKGKETLSFSSTTSPKSQTQ